MTDNLHNRGPRDRARISLEEEHEVRYWTQTLGVSKDALKKAVEAVGHSSQAVSDYLRGKLLYTSRTRLP